MQTELFPTDTVEHRQSIQDGFIMSAICRKGFYSNFGITESECIEKGIDVSEITKVKVKASLNQIVGLEYGEKKIDYWGWFDFEKGLFLKINCTRFALSTMLPCAITVMESIEKGKSYRIEISKA